VKKIVGMPDSGFFVEYDTKNADFAKAINWVLNSMNVTGSFDEDCVVSNPQNTSKCLSVVFSAPYISTPIFVLQSEYDQWQIDNFLKTNDSKIINDFGRDLSDSLKRQVLVADRNGVFLDSCTHHCGFWNAIKIDGFTQATGFKQWYEQQHFGGRWIQGRPYPCASCCS